MLRWMTGVSLSERKSNEWVRSMLAIDDIGEVMRRKRLRWFGHVERRDEGASSVLRTHFDLPINVSSNVG